MLASLLLCLAWMTDAVPSSGRPLPFSDERWELHDGVRRARVEGREVLEFETGTAVRRDVVFRDGTIDFDVQVTRRRSFVYLLFRMASDEDHEEVYLRPHKSDLPDALQYAPVWQGESAWQLHRGPGGTASIPFTTDWTHVRLVVRGERAALFVGDLSKPALYVPRLSRDPEAGYVALRAFVPKDTPGSGPIARYADLVVRPDQFAFDLASMPAESAAPEGGVIREWALSRSFAPDPGGGTSAPDVILAGDFQRVSAEPGGLVQLDRFVKRVDSPAGSALVARLHLRTPAARSCALDLGWSDTATVVLNGRPIYRGVSSYAFALGRDGVISFDQGRLYLPLAAGDNELRILVADAFGGAGLMGRTADCPGVEIEAR